MVMRDMLGSSVGPTLRVSMLKPRPLNMPAMRVSTPNLFSTSTEIVCRIKGVAMFADFLFPSNAKTGAAARGHCQPRRAPIDFFCDAADQRRHRQGARK